MFFFSKKETIWKIYGRMMYVRNLYIMSIFQEFSSFKTEIAGNQQQFIVHTKTSLVPKQNNVNEVLQLRNINEVLQQKSVTEAVFQF